MCDSPYVCRGCGKTIDYDQGAISLTNDEALHVCAECWDTLPLSVRLQLECLWKESRAKIAFFEKFTEMADAALSGWHFPGIGGAERN